MEKNSATVIKRTLWIALTVGVMALITWFSSQPGGSSQNMSMGLVDTIAQWFGLSLTPEQGNFLNLLARKTAHFTLYFCMGVGAAGSWMTFRVRRDCQWAAAILICAAFAATDELHQWLADAGRQGSGWDVLLDTIGAGCGSGGFFALNFLVQWRRQSD